MLVAEGALDDLFEFAIVGRGDVVADAVRGEDGECAVGVVDEDQVRAADELAVDAAGAEEFDELAEGAGGARVFEVRREVEADAHGGCGDGLAPVEEGGGGVFGAFEGLGVVEVGVADALDDGPGGDIEAQLARDVVEAVDDLVFLVGDDADAGVLGDEVGFESGWDHGPSGARSLGRLPRCEAKTRQPSGVPEGAPETAAGVGVARGGAARSLALLAKDIKIAHSVFAMPFAVLGACAAWVLTFDAGRTWVGLAGRLALVVACMVLARSWAMLFNRLADRAIDAKNARTKGRVIASGAVSRSAGWGVAIACAIGFVGVCALFQVFFENPWPLYLSVPVLAWIGFYSLTKRFTSWCHVFLGGALAASPVAAGIAMDPASVVQVPMLWWIAGFVLLWVAGFDVIYALQDEEFDRREGLKSMPAKVGAERAVWISRGMHAMAMVCLLAAWTSVDRLGAIFGVGVGLAGLLLVVEQVILQRRGMKGLDVAFFTVNGVVSCVLGTLGVVDLFVDWG